MGFSYVCFIFIFSTPVLLLRQDNEELAKTILSSIYEAEEQVNCSRTNLARYNFNFTPTLRLMYGRTTKFTVIAANILNSVYQAEVSVQPRSFLFDEVVKGLVKSDSLIKAAAVILRDNINGNNNIPFAYRDEGDHVTITDAGSVWQVGDEDEPGSEWFIQDVSPRISEKVGEEGVWSRAEDGKWTTPFYDCGLTNKWLAGFSVPFFSGGSHEVKIRGVVAVMYDLGAVDVNQCAVDLSLFADTHRCHRSTMQCHPTSGQGLRPGAYMCSCRRNYFFTDRNNPHGWFNGTQVDAILADEGNGNVWNCSPCRSGCESCVDESPCFVEYDVVLRGFPLGVQSFSMTIAIVIAIIVFRLRKSVTIAAGMWTMLEMILIGAILIYATVVCRYFEPSTLNCLLEPWLRELGFAFCYGAIVLKMYKILVEFRTRKAHRWIVRDKDLLKYLAAIVVVVSGYMSAWTALNVHLLQDNYSLLAIGVTSKGLRYVICRSAWWEYVTEIGELLFLLFGVHLSYHARNATSDFREKRYLCLAIFIELLASISLHVLRHVLWLDVDPDYIFLMYFVRCQSTVTVILILIFGPKLWYYHRPPREDPEHRGEHSVHETVKLQDGVTSNGEVDIAEINLADMDPEDIRTELRRVYTQLQVLRNKTMRKDNPHISKRRGGRKATHRRFSLQAFHPRHRPHNGGTEHEAETSKTPEESTASGDGAPDPDAPTMTSSATVTFKNLQK